MLNNLLFNFCSYIFILDVNNNIGDYMRVRLGYVAISMAVDSTSSSSYTYSEYLKNNDLDKLDKIIISNLEGLDNIIDYNIKNNIHFYRMSSKIIPLATKGDVNFDYIDRYKDYYRGIGKKIKDSGMRVDFHPDQYTVLNSTKKEVVNSSVETLKYHYRLLDAMGICDKVILIHVGSSVFGKVNSIYRFINNFNKLPKYLRSCIAIENDDKVFNIEDVIGLSDVIEVPIILDYHHYKCNGSDIDYKKIFDSWGDRVPKIHFSSPKNKREFRSHNDYINSDDFIGFINEIKYLDRDIDIMIEAKCKDDALFRLVRELKYKTDYKFIDETTFVVDKY